MPDSTSLADLVRRLDSVRLLCVGDVILDRFIYGEAERLSPEAPVPVLKVTREEAMLGGAGNVARNLASLDVGVTFVSIVGNDEIGREVRKLCGRSSGRGATSSSTAAGRPAARPAMSPGSSSCSEPTRKSPPRSRRPSRAT
ncbi:MAG: PfkB family carbohydrate kinase [Bauldia litoralis]